MGKILAESAFSDAALRSGRWDAITCCSGNNVGPILSARQKDAGPWQQNIESMQLGKYKQDVLGSYRARYTVDVRDMAEAHIRLFESGNIKNSPCFIVWSTETWNVEDVCESIDRLLPGLGFAGAKFVEWFPENIRAREAEFGAIWEACELRNERIRETLGLEFRALDVSIRDYVEWLLAVGKVEPKLKLGFELQT